MRNFTAIKVNPTDNDMEDVAAYRNLIFEALRSALDAKGAVRLTEEQARNLANELSDAEIEEGMPFNTPEEVAALLLESGLE